MKRILLNLLLIAAPVAIRCSERPDAQQARGEFRFLPFLGSAASHGGQWGLIGAGIGSIIGSMRSMGSSFAGATKAKDVSEWTGRALIETPASGFVGGAKGLYRGGKYGLMSGIGYEAIKAYNEHTKATDVRSKLKEVALVSGQLGLAGIKPGIMGVGVGAAVGGFQGFSKGMQPGIKYQEVSDFVGDTFFGRPISGFAMGLRRAVQGGKYGFGLGAGWKAYAIYHAKQTKVKE